MKNATIEKRTFAATKYPKGSSSRAALNESVEHSEYYVSEKWYLKYPFFMSGGTTHPNQPFIFLTFKTKKQAVEYMESH